MKRLFLDIETSPGKYYAWGAGYDKFIDYRNIIEERKIICIAWQWENAITHVKTWDKNRDDKQLIAGIIPIIAQADEVIGHNIDRFDMPWIRTRALVHELPAVQVARTVDTLKWARRYFYLQSNKLDYLARFLGIGKKIPQREGNWNAVTQGDRSALKAMAQYCAHDVNGLLEPVWKRLGIVCPVASHAGVIEGGPKWSCPRCASQMVRYVRGYITAAGNMKYQMQCKACGGYFSIAKAEQAKFEKR